MLQQTKTHNERHTEIPQNTHKTTKKTTKTTKTKKTNKKTIKKIKKTKKNKKNEKIHFFLKKTQTAKIDNYPIIIR
jgi:hypothetical protein